MNFKIVPHKNHNTSAVKEEDVHPENEKHQTSTRR